MYVFPYVPFPQTWQPHELVAFAESRAVTDCVGKEYLIHLLLQEDNPVRRLCAEGIKPGESLTDLALRDLSLLFNALAQEAPLAGYRPSQKRRFPSIDFQASWEELVASDTPESLWEKLLIHYRRFGFGDTAPYVAFRWEGSLRGVKAPDAVSLSQLYCLDWQKEEILQNTRTFLNGQPANNVLLYGNSGCGKSSLVKAVFHQYAEEGLRLVQIAKNDLDDLPALLSTLAPLPFRYIVFLDDLSFESDDVQYKTLKTVLEGGIEGQPSNVLFYATSNRFHLVNETWEDRSGGDVHIADTRNEKLSLSERFGIRISFYAPGQKEYLIIVEGLLNRVGIPFTPELRSEALQWAVAYNGRSGRTATQFVRSVLAKRADA